MAAIPRTKVRLFVPSDLGLRYGEEGMKIPLLKMKQDVQDGARQAGIPVTVVLIANFAEFTLGSIMNAIADDVGTFSVMGIDVDGNRLLYTGNAAKEKAGMCSADYVAAAYVSIFTASPVSEISNRAIGLVELAPTGEEIAAALEKKHGKPPTIFNQTVEKAVAELNSHLASDSIMSLIAPA
ncbi:hypothetical protein HJFPF1_08427 [Paramyrothecium foliicola]|nr:hypothetical protein HJFPF1_08427 [Paramyrothecium foliicola]